MTSLFFHTIFAIQVCRGGIVLRFDIQNDRDWCKPLPLNEKSRFWLDVQYMKRVIVTPRACLDFFFYIIIFPGLCWLHRKFYLFIGFLDFFSIYLLLSFCLNKSSCSFLPERSLLVLCKGDVLSKVLLVFAPSVLIYAWNLVIINIYF